MGTEHEPNAVERALKEVVVDAIVALCVSKDLNVAMQYAATKNSGRFALIEREYSDEDLTNLPTPCPPVYAGEPEDVGCQYAEISYCELDCCGCTSYFEDHDMGATVPICRSGGHRRKGCKMYAPTKEWSNILKVVGK